jgi:hypothetical protein
MDMKQHLNGGIKKLLLALGVSGGLLMNVSSTSAAPVIFDFEQMALGNERYDVIGVRMPTNSLPQCELLRSPYSSEAILWKTFP